MTFVHRSLVLPFSPEFKILLRWKSFCKGIILLLSHFLIVSPFPPVSSHEGCLLHPSFPLLVWKTLSVYLDLLLVLRRQCGTVEKGWRLHRNRYRSVEVFSHGVMTHRFLMFDHEYNRTRLALILTFNSMMKSCFLFLFELNYSFCVSFRGNN